MRLSLVVLFTLLFAVVIVHSATTRKPRPVPARTTKATVRQSAYAYLRSVRGTKSCKSGTCPFWERHGRSFAALRCYSQQYQECTCLHRMCFSSCMFTREVCNQEMVSCLRQICPRCMPPSASTMCSVYDSMAERVAEALSVFACYPCCPMLQNQPSNASMTTTPMMPMITTTVPAETSPPITTTLPVDLLTEVPTITPSIEESTPVAVEGGENSGVVFPGSGGAQAIASNEPANTADGSAPNRNQRVQPTIRTTKRTSTTRRTSRTTRRPNSTAKKNPVKNVPKTSPKPTKKPQSSGTRPKN